MSNQFSANASAIQPPKVCKKSEDGGYKYYSTLPPFLQWYVNWDDPTLGPGFAVEGYGIAHPTAPPNVFYGIIGDANGQNVEARWTLDETETTFLVSLNARDASSVHANAHTGIEPLISAAPWDSGAQYLVAVGRPTGPTTRATS